MSDGLLLVLIPLVFLVASAYASVGLGGGTGYLAIMTLVGISAAVMTPTALLLNLVVTGVALMRFGLAGRLKWRLFLPFLLPAMPAAFLGGILTADRRIFLAVLAAALAIAAIAMFLKARSAQEQEYEPDRLHLLLVGNPSRPCYRGSFRFLGIGGGVFLGPIILFLGWAGPKEVAAMNSALILIFSALHSLRMELKLELS